MNKAPRAIKIDLYQVLLPWASKITYCLSIAFLPGLTTDKLYYRLNVGKKTRPTLLNYTQITNYLTKSWLRNIISNNCCRVFFCGRKVHEQVTLDRRHLGKLVMQVHACQLTSVVITVMQEEITVGPDYVIRGGTRNFPMGADSSNEGATLRFSETGGISNIFLSNLDDLENRSGWDPQMSPVPCGGFDGGLACSDGGYSLLVLP